MDEAIKYPVEVYLYDLSQGAAKELSPGLLGRALEGVWHSAVVVYGREYSFTKAGVISVIPGGFVLGEPQRIESLGETQLPYSVFLDFILSLGDSKYKPGSWDLFKFNSNHFADEVGQFLAGAGLPKFVLDLPQEITDTALWQTICKEWEENMTKSGSLAGVSLGLMTSRSMTSVTPAMGSGSLRSLSDNFIPRMIRDQESPELEELQAQIAALRADQLSLEERRNALNLTTKEEKRKKKKDKEDKKEKKEKKLRRKQLSEEGFIDSSERAGSDTDIRGGSRPLHLAAVCDHSDESQSAADARKRSESAQPPACDINSCRPSAPVTTLAAGQPSLLSSDSGTGDPTKSGAKDSSVQCENHKSPNSSPTHSILSNHRSSDNRLGRVKSLKRVSFEEKPNIIDERTPEPLEVTEKADEATCAVDNCIKEEVEDQDLPPPLEDVIQTVSQSPRSPTPPPVTNMASAEEQPLEIPTDGGDGEPVMPKKERKPHIKGITFRDFDHVKDFEDLVRTIVTLCSGEEQERLREMEDWIVKNEGTWVLSEGFNVFLSNVFHRQEWPSDARVAMLRLLAYGAKEDDIVLILHMDRKDHSVMNYAQSFDRLAVKEQESIALLFCNLFETASASEWLMYISEWDAPGGGLPLSNIRVTTKVAVNALLGDSPDLVNYGSALMANLGDKEVKAVVFDDVCSELAMAILQFFQGKPDEEKVWRCMKALLKFCTIGSREVPQLVKMIGPEPSKFSGLSKRVDELIEPIMAKLASVPMF